MSKRILIKTLSIALLWGGLSLAGIMLPAKDYSDTERRPLASMPSYSPESVLSGEFTSQFETYSLDQFPLRDQFRSLKAFTTLYLLNQKQVNNLYLADGYIVKAEYPLQDAMITNAANRFQNVYDTHLADTDTQVFLSIVPDKNFFLAGENGQPAMDYEKLVASLTDALPTMEYIDIFPTLGIKSYYYTDTHWKQETLLDCANVLIQGMNGEVPISPLSADLYTIQTVDAPFYGVYYGQLGLPVQPDVLSYLTNDALEACMVTNYDTGSPVEKPMYDTSKINSKDPYELFVCGSSALVTIENPHATTQKELIIFRDSFSSAIAPLFMEHYAKVTLVDIRYIYPSMLSNFITFNDQDILFLYSTLVLNTSTSLK